jgi:hypothetical protein
MNQLRFTCLLFCAGVVIFLTSCGGGGSEEKSSTDTTTNTDTTSTAATAPAATSTISTTPQNMMVATHKVKDFAKWKAAYDGHDSMRLASGIHSYVVGRGLNDSNMVLVAVKTDDMEKAKAFAKSPSLKKAMQEGGVMGAPTISFVTMVWQDTAVLSQPFRSRTSFTVKDWNTWKNAFDSDSSKQQRMDNGIVDRAYGHDANDDHKVVVVVALMDTAKAKAYWKSDALKQRMAQSGVVGQPQRFLYRVVQRY